jgi:decaprenyl-phosphate phosphoribosyltransferase
MSIAAHPVVRPGVMRALWRLARPRQWIKNLLVMMPVLFSGRWKHWDDLLTVGIATTLFCVAASLCYVINDLHDIENDRRHPDKRLKRPLAAGHLTVPQAVGLGLVLLSVLIAASAWQWRVTAGLGAYLALSLAYSRWLKRVAVVDLFALSSGFVLRTWVGSAALGLTLSAWMGISVLSLALFLCSLKRLRELRRYGSLAREVLSGYSDALLVRYAELSAASALTCYALYILTQRPALAVSFPFALFGLFRYWQLVEIQEQGESPGDALLSDPVQAAVAVGWLISCLWAGR